MGSSTAGQPQWPQYTVYSPSAKVSDLKSAPVLSLKDLTLAAKGVEFESIGSSYAFTSSDWIKNIGKSTKALMVDEMKPAPSRIDLP